MKLYMSHFTITKLQKNTLRSFIALSFFYQQAHFLLLKRLMQHFLLVIITVYIFFFSFVSPNRLRKQYHICIAIKQNYPLKVMTS